MVSDDVINCNAVRVDGSWVFLKAYVSIVANNSVYSCVDEGNSSSRKTRQQVAYAVSLLWQAKLAQAEEAMRLHWSPQRQGSTLQLEHQVQEKNWPGHRQNANFETFGKKGKERIQRRMHGRCLRQEEEQTGLNVVAPRVCSPDNSADETTRMSTRMRLQIDGRSVY